MASSRSRIAVRVVAAFALLALVVTAAGSAAQAQSAGSSPTLLLRRVDSPGGQVPRSSTLDFVWTGGAGDLANARVAENGQDAPVTASPSVLADDLGVVFVVDSGPGMDKDNVLTSVRQSLQASIQAHPTVRYGIVQAGDRADIKTQITSDAARLKTGIDSIGPTKGSAVWQALSLAGSMFADLPRLQRNIVLVTADNDNVSPGSEAVGRTAVLANAVTMWTAQYLGAGLDPEPYDALVARAGGQSLSTSDPLKVGELVTRSITDVSTHQYRLSYTSSVADGAALHIALTVGGQTSQADVLAGRGVYEGGEALRPLIGAKEATLPFVDNKVALAVALLLALGAVAGAAYALTSMLTKDDLSDVLQPYSDAYSLIEGEPESMSLTKNPLIQRAVALTEQVAENQGFLTRAEGALERANLPLRAGEALFFYVVIVILVTVVPLLLTQNVMVALLAGLVGALVPVSAVNFLASKRRKNFLSQLPDTLSLLSGTLRAGYSLMQGVEAVSHEVDEPMGLELRRVVTESRLGRPLEESLEASAERMDSNDFSWAVMAIRIQREVGGNLSELLLTVADTMVARERLRRDVASLTAEGRVSAVVLAGLPPALGMIMFVLNRDYVSSLFTDGLGIGMLVTAVVSMLIGFAWMRKIINIEI